MLSLGGYMGIRASHQHARRLALYRLTQPLPMTGDLELHQRNDIYFMLDFKNARISTLRREVPGIW